MKCLWCYLIPDHYLRHYIHCWPIYLFICLFVCCSFLFVCLFYLYIYYLFKYSIVYLCIHSLSSSISHICLYLHSLLAFSHCITFSLWSPEAICFLFNIYPPVYSFIYLHFYHHPLTYPLAMCTICCCCFFSSSVFFMSNWRESHGIKMS